MTDNLLHRYISAHTFLRTSIAAVTFLTAATVLCGEVAYGQQAVPNQVLADLIRQQKLVSGEQTVKAVLDQNQAIITCERNPNDNDDACKRRAILIAKCVFDSQPNEIQKTKIQFLNLKNNSLSTVGIKRSEITMFGDGKMDEKDLLASIDFSTEGVGGGADQAQVADGEMLLQRTMLLRRIDKMKERGTNVTAFMNIFNEIEGLAKSGDTKKLGVRIQYLSEKVSEQEKMVQETAARRPVGSATVGAGRPMTVSGGSTSSGPVAALPPNLVAALNQAQVGPQVTEQVRNLRDTLLKMQANGPRPQRALQTLDDAILSKDVFKMLAAFEAVPKILKGD